MSLLNPRAQSGAAAPDGALPAFGQTGKVPGGSAPDALPHWELQERYSRLFSLSLTGKALISPDGRVLDANDALRQLLAHPQPDLTAHTLEALTAPEDYARERVQLQDLLAGREQCYDLEKRFVRPGGEVVWTRVAGCLVRNPQGEPLYFLLEVVDVSAQKQAVALLEQANQELHSLASLDALVGIGNRRAFDERFKEEVAHARRDGTPFSLVFFDLDHFKRYNDKYGHVAGDEILREMGRLLRSSMRPRDFPARYGGEEFTVLLPATGIDEAVQVAERMRQTIEEHTWLNAPVTASFGVAVWSGEDARTLLQKADSALYAAKGAGRNCVRRA